MSIIRSKTIALFVTLTMVLSIISSSIVSAAGESITVNQAAKFLEEVGVLKGADGDLMLDKNLTRQDSVVLLSRLLGREEEAEIYPSDTMSFKDIKDNYYKSYIAWAQDNQLVQGYDDETFGFGDYLTAWQTKALMVRVLGYTSATDDEINEMAELLGVSKGSTAENNKSITRADMALLTYNTVNSKTIDDTILGEDLGIFKEGEQPILSSIKASATTTALDYVTITGSVNPADSKVFVGEEIAKVQEDGTFSIDVSLKVGENIFDVIAKNGTKTDAKEVKITKTSEGSEYEMSVKITGEDTIKVTFSHAVVDTDDVDFTLKGNSKVSINVEWNKEKTEAELTTASDLIEGTYTLTVEGIDFVDSKNQVSFNVVENGIAKIEILGTGAALSEYPGESDGAGDLVLSYRIYDKYDVDITDKIDADELQVVTNIVLEGSKFDLKEDEGKMFLDVDEKKEKLEEGDTFSITIISSETGVTANKTLKIGEQSQVSKIDIIKIEYEDKSEKMLINQSNAAYILLDVFDQYGVEIIDEDKLEDSKEVLYIISDKNVKLIPEDYTNDKDEKKLRLVINTRNLDYAKNVNVTIVSKLSGNSDSIVLAIKETSKPDEVKIGSLEQMVAVGDQEETLIIPIEVYDQEGVQLSIDEIIDAYNDDKLEIKGSGTLDDAGIKLATSGKNRGKIINGNDIGDKEGTGIITVSTDYDVSTLSVSVKEEAYAKSFEYDVEPAANLLDGAKTMFNYKFYDQYGRLMVNPPKKVKVTLESSNTAILSVTPTITDASVVCKERSVIVKSEGKNGSAYITAQLYKAEDGTSWPNDYVAVDKIKTSISVIKGIPSSIKFEIENIPTLVSLEDDDCDIDGDDPYSRPIIIKATDSNGKTYAIPDSRIIRVTSSNATDKVSDNDTSKYIMISKVPVEGDIDAQNGYYVVAAREVDDIDWDGEREVKTTIRVMISTDDGVKEVTKEITISKEQPEAKEIKFAYMPSGEAPVDIDSNPYELKPEAEEITEITGTVSYIVSQEFYIYEIDQYGVYSRKTPSKLIVINTDRFDGSTIEYDDDRTLENFSKNDIIDGKEVHLMYEAANGQYATFKIIATDGIDEDDADF